MLRHGSVVRPTMYVASMDIKTAFDEARLDVEVPRLWQKMAMQLLANVEENWVRKRMGVLLDFEGQRTRRQLLDHVPFRKSPGTDAEGSDSGS